jgi:hypothetical protein
LLRALVHWALLSSDAVRQIIDDAYKLPPNSRVEREELDANSGLGVIPLATIKGDNYYLIEGKDTRFRIYHETNPHHKIINISSVAEDKDSLIAFAGKLSEGGKLEQALGTTIRETIIARIETAEQRRIRAEQAAIRLATWQASAPVYNTRTRGKKVNYSELEGGSASDEDDERGSRRRAREGRDQQAVEYTASGRMVKRPRTANGMETREIVMKEDPEDSEEEMEWSVYSDKGETEEDDIEDEGDEEEVEDYDIQDRKLLLHFKIGKERLRNVTTKPVNVINGNSNILRLGSPLEQPISRQPASTAQQSVPQPGQYHPSSPRVYPGNVPSRSPTQSFAPTSYARGPSPPVPIRSTQLSPRPTPQAMTSKNPFHSSPTPPQPRPSQTPPQPYGQPQPFRQSPYPVAQYQAPTPSPRIPYHNGYPSFPPSSGSLNPQSFPAPHSASPPRPFGIAQPGVRRDQSPYPGNPPTQNVYPKQTWSSATFQPNPIPNGGKPELSRHPSDPSPSQQLPVSASGGQAPEAKLKEPVNGEAKLG